MGANSSGDPEQEDPQLRIGRKNREVKLDLDENSPLFVDMSPSGIVKSLANFPDVEFLYLSNSNFKDDGFRLIAKALAEGLGNNVKILDLSENSLTNVSALSLAHAIKSNEKLSLQEVYLDRNRIKDSGATALVDALESNESIVKISFEGNPLSDAVKQVAENLSARKSIRLHSSSVEAGVVHFDHVNFETNLKEFMSPDKDSKTQILSPDEVREILTAGDLFTKYKYDQNKQRYVWCDDELMQLRWNPQKTQSMWIKGFLWLKDVKSIRLSYDNIKSSSCEKFQLLIDRNPKICLSIVTNQRTLDLEARTPESRDRFVFALITRRLEIQIQQMEEYYDRLRRAQRHSERTVSHRLLHNSDILGLNFANGPATFSKEFSGLEEKKKGDPREDQVKKAKQLFQKLSVETIRDQNESGAKLETISEIKNLPEEEEEEEETSTENENEEAKEDVTSRIKNLCETREEWEKLKQISKAYNDGQASARKYFSALMRIVGRDKAAELLPELAKKIPNVERSHSLLTFSDSLPQLIAEHERKLTEEKKLVNTEKSQTLMEFLFEELDQDEEKLKKFKTASTMFGQKEVTPKQYWSFFVKLFCDRVPAVFPRVIKLVKDPQQKVQLQELFAQYQQLGSSRRRKPEKNVIKKRSKSSDKIKRDPYNSLKTPPLRKSARKPRKTKPKDGSFRPRSMTSENNAAASPSERDALLSYNQFKEILSSMPGDYTTEQQKEIFSSIDKDIDGFISWEDFTAYFLQKMSDENGNNEAEMKEPKPVLEPKKPKNSPMQKPRMERTESFFVRRVQDILGTSDKHLKEEELKQEFQRQFSKDVKKWIRSSGKLGKKYGDLRIMLTTLYQIFPFFEPPDKFAVDYESSTPSSLKKVLKKTIPVIHPDRQKEMEKKVLASLVFSAVNDAHSNFVTFYEKQFGKESKER